ncbi:homoserine O-acetyltransferase/O-succinyltransferase family protein [Methylocystis parvus]|uniref:Homoserine O-succinyltransferase n=1 Tax=Methylocystis parvus TaxID=134 RepID=A0A6B8M6G2_9HYPH|nr:homoserine O-succinyltransferase [Methylocystis parvus]QGM98491.1 homoserine O-succinyltransferase [Methylocystis parvus]WBK01170.1 homoserine O-succinyltransferase [Methylocystis parvus OBBP]
MTGQARRPGDVLEIALVNNMPDQALSATQMQFARLIRAAAGGRVIRWRCYALPGLERSDTARRYLERSHEDIEALYRRGADALIVTGCEPRAARLDDEPYWPHMQTLVDWARGHTLSTIWSCLAAHAATLHLAGVERRPSPRKTSGVFSFVREGEHWSRNAQPRASLTPHSRYNDLPREALERRGFHVASYADSVGVDMYWRKEPSLFVFLQGHPEYDADTLLKEYRRDALRYLAGERADYPSQPENYFSAATQEKLDALCQRIVSGDRMAAEGALANILSAEECRADWALDTTRLYQDWLDEVSHRAVALRASA